MVADSAGINREKAMLAAMVQIYCRGHHIGCHPFGRRPKGWHDRDRLCTECRNLLEYGNERLDRCPYASVKGPCAQCDIHCYKPEMRDRVRDVMRYAGPRMLSRHPILAVGHMIDGWRNKHHRKKQKGTP